MRIQVIAPDGPLFDTKAFWRSMKQVVSNTAIDGKRMMATYPARQHFTNREIYGKPFVSDRARRYFFAALRDGTIEVPYKRTRTLGRSWNAEVTDTGDRIEGLIYCNSNMAPYVYFVQTDQDQTMMMAAIGWETVEAMMERLGTIFKQRVDEVLEDYA